jgi:hypothetical protein
MDRLVRGAFSDYGHFIGAGELRDVKRRDIWCDDKVRWLAPHRVHAATRFESWFNSLSLYWTKIYDQSPFRWLEKLLV